MQPSKSPSLLRAAEAGDRVGMVGSLVCAIHCALLPLLLSALPALGLGMFASADIDQAFAVFAGILGITTLSIGFRRHRAFHAWALLVPGLIMIWTGSFTGLHDHSLAHAALMTAGGLLVAGAHMLNLRLSHAPIGRPVASRAGVEAA